MNRIIALLLAVTLGIAIPIGFVAARSPEIREPMERIVAPPTATPDVLPLEIKTSTNGTFLVAYLKSDLIQSVHLQQGVTPCEVDYSGSFRVDYDNNVYMDTGPTPYTCWQFLQIHVIDKTGHDFWLKYSANIVVRK